jgi:hypothetical protein
MVLALILSHISPFVFLSNKCKSFENLSGGIVNHPGGIGYNFKQHIEHEFN